MAQTQAPPNVRYHHHIPKPPEGSDRWIRVYPAYINKDKTIAEGRRIPKDKAISTPSCKEIMEVLSTTGLQIYVENKIYTREKSKEPPNWGCVKAEITKNGEVLNSKFKKREDIYLFAAENIPKLKSRTNPKVAPVPQAQQSKPGKGKKKK